MSVHWCLPLSLISSQSSSIQPLHSEGGNILRDMNIFHFLVFTSILISYQALIGLGKSNDNNEDSQTNMEDSLGELLSQLKNEPLMW